jgi:hypothetical protein
LKLSGVKVKEGEEYQGVPLTLRQVTITTETGDTLFDEEGRAVTSCVIVQGPPRVAATLSGDDKALLALHWPEPRKSEEVRGMASGGGSHHERDLRQGQEAADGVRARSARQEPGREGRLRTDWTGELRARVVGRPDPVAGSSLFGRLKNGPAVAVRRLRRSRRNLLITLMLRPSPDPSPNPCSVGRLGRPVKRP